jgi:hypothetical protein
MPTSLLARTRGRRFTLRRSMREAASCNGVVSFMVRGAREMTSLTFCPWERNGLTGPNNASSERERLFGAEFGPTRQVSFAQDADHASFVADDRQPANAMPQHQLDRLGNLGAGRYGNDFLVITSESFIANSQQGSIPAIKILFKVEPN